MNAGGRGPPQQGALLTPILGGGFGDQSEALWKPGQGCSLGGPWRPAQQTSGAGGDQERPRGRCPACDPACQALGMWGHRGGGSCRAQARLQASGGGASPRRGPGQWRPRGEGREGTVWSMDEAGDVLAREGWPQHLARPLAGAAGPPRLPRALRVAGSGLFILAPESVVIWACQARTSSVGLQSSLPEGGSSVRGDRGAVEVLSSWPGGHPCGCPSHPPCPVGVPRPRPLRPGKASVHTKTYKHRDLHTHTCVGTHTHSHTHTHLCTHACTLALTHMHRHTLAHTHLHTRAHLCTHTHT